MRGANLVKLLKVIDMLGSHRGATVEQIADELEIDRTNVYKWLRIVEEELGFPLVSEKDIVENRTRKKLDKDFHQKLGSINLPDIRFTLSEIISLFLLKGESKTMKDSSLEENIASAFSKIALFAPKGLAEKLDKLQSIFLPDAKMAKSYKGKEQIIDDLTKAMLGNCTCVITYHSFWADKLKEYEIDPLHFFEHNGGVYLFVNTTKYGDIRILAVERICKVTPTDTIFTYPDNFDPEEKLRHSFGVIYDDPLEVEIWFSASQVRYVTERTWSQGQEIIHQNDGSIVLKMLTSGRDDVKRWILGYGAEAKVLEPRDLREEIIEEIARLEKNYQS
jgi:predicted DNA-binding transcriptional regulator YafY